MCRALAGVLGLLSLLAAATEASRLVSGTTRVHAASSATSEASTDSSRLSSQGLDAEALEQLQRCVADRFCAERLAAYAARGQAASNPDDFPYTASAFASASASTHHNGLIPSATKAPAHSPAPDPDPTPAPTPDPDPYDPHDHGGGGGGDDDPPSDDTATPLLKAGAAALLVAEAAAGVYAPLLLRRLRSPQWYLSLLNCFSGGIFLAAGIVHLLPHCAEAQEALGPIGPNGDYPLYLVLVTVGYCLVFYMERVLFDVHGEGHSHCQHSNVFTHSSYYKAITHRSHRPGPRPALGSGAVSFSSGQGQSQTPLLLPGPSASDTEVCGHAHGPHSHAHGPGSEPHHGGGGAGGDGKPGGEGSPHGRGHGHDHGPGESCGSHGPHAHPHPHPQAHAHHHRNRSDGSAGLRPSGSTGALLLGVSSEAVLVSTRTSVTGVVADGDETESCHSEHSPRAECVCVDETPVPALGSATSAALSHANSHGSMQGAALRPASSLGSAQGSALPHAHSHSSAHAPARVHTHVHAEAGPAGRLGFAVGAGGAAALGGGAGPSHASHAVASAAAEDTLRTPLLAAEDSTPEDSHPTPPRPLPPPPPLLPRPAAGADGAGRRARSSSSGGGPAVSSSAAWQALQEQMAQQLKLLEECRYHIHHSDGLRKAGHAHGPHGGGGSHGASHASQPAHDAPEDGTHRPSPPADEPRAPAPSRSHSHAHAHVHAPAPAPAPDHDHAEAAHSHDHADGHSHSHGPAHADDAGCGQERAGPSHGPPEPACEPAGPGLSSMPDHNHVLAHAEEPRAQARAQPEARAPPLSPVAERPEPEPTPAGGCGGHGSAHDHDEHHHSHQHGLDSLSQPLLPPQEPQQRQAAPRQHQHHLSQHSHLQEQQQQVSELSDGPHNHNHSDGHHNNHAHHHDHSDQHQLACGHHHNHNHLDPHDTHDHGHRHEIRPRFRFMHGIVLLLAMALHTALECIALGLIDSRPQFLVLLAAIASHKPVSALALSSRFLKEGASMSQVTAYVGPFVFVAPLSILAGVYIGRVAPVASLIFSCFATGTFLYVGASEVIMEEFEGEMRADRRDISTHTARYLKFGAVLTAVGLVAASGFLPEAHHH